VEVVTYILPDTLKNRTSQQRIFQMILSVVIVSYEVKFFLEQCLSSLQKAVDGSIELSGRTEVFIMDNASVDGTVDFLQPLFPDFRFIRNTRNLGFAKANNQAIPHCHGKFILFLNPDTIISEDSLQDCISFFGHHPEAGALGVHMVDGRGVYLKESKRGFPSPMASFYKMTGLIRLFPRSKIFSAYYQGHLDPRSSHPVEVLSGAFMMVRKSVLDITGGFDERFFMYAEDIDLSWRIREAGFVNYYFSGTSIIHFKGESTRKDSRYIKMFYTAMDQFIKKHFTRNLSVIQRSLILSGMRFHQLFAFFRIPFQPSKPNAGLPVAACIKGDRDSSLVWRQKLAGLGIPVVEKQSAGMEIIYLEGPALSWKSIISEVAKNNTLYRYRFHGSQTHAAIASHSGGDPGKFLIL
jgi:N-acetylglucosaminyl-diphospho-decaprenol L-rhamnosyltransferase